MSAEPAAAPGEGGAAPAPGRERAFRLLAVLVASLLALGLVEAALRLAAGGTRAGPRPTGVPERHASDWHQPDRRPPAGPGAGPPFRIAAVGDSFTWGVGVYQEDAWPARLERLLWRLGLPAQVAVETVCRPGWGTVQEVEALRRELARRDYDLVVLGYVLNDAEPPAGELLKRLQAPLERRSPRGLARGLYRGSALFRLSWERLENSRQRRSFIRYYRQLYGAQPGWNGARQALDDLHDLAGRHGVPVVVAVFPVFDGPLDERYPYRELHHRVAREAADRGFGVVELLPAYRRVDPRRLALVPFTDAHPNELAHRLAAEAIRDYLVAEKLLPGM